MAKQLKINIKNTQIAEAVQLGKLKGKLGKKREEKPAEPKADPKQPSKNAASVEESVKEETPRIKARSKSAFAEPRTSKPIINGAPEQERESEKGETVSEKAIPETEAEDTTIEQIEGTLKTPPETEGEESIQAEGEILLPENQRGEAVEEVPSSFTEETPQQPEAQTTAQPTEKKSAEGGKGKPEELSQTKVKLGPTGKHINDLLPQKPKAKAQTKNLGRNTQTGSTPPEPVGTAKEKAKQRGKEKVSDTSQPAEAARKGGKFKFKEFRDVKPSRKLDTKRAFDARDRQGLRGEDEGSGWRKKRHSKGKIVQEDTTIRPTSLKIRIPIAIKDLAAEMKLKASQLIQKLFLQGVAVTLNDLLEDETTIQLLGHEFGCEITIDTSEEERIRITDKSIKEEVAESQPDELVIRAPVVAFMGHVDHGKTSLIDRIRKSNRIAGEAGAITQHIGAFCSSTPVGNITILDTPGHEAFSAMRARGADVTDIVVLVVAGDEGIRQQTIEAIHHAKAANVTIVVAINKCDKPNFDQEQVYRQLADQELLPEAWGGEIITINCSAVTGEGIEQLLEMLALQAEVLELKANPTTRARGRVIESEMHKGHGSVATILVQNGTLHLGDSLVFDQHWGKVKTMRDGLNQHLQEAGPSIPVEITGLSGLPEAGQEFIVVKNEKEARDIAAVRMQGFRQVNLLQKKKASMENLLQQASTVSKKMLNVILRADVQGSLEALKAALLKIKSDKAELNVIFSCVGEVSESDVQLAAASKAVIVGFHTQIESHADQLVKELGIQVRMHDIIYHAIDDVADLMAGLLDKIAVETDKGKAEVKTTFKSSHYGIIAGCLVAEGSIHRNHQIRLKRDGEVIWKGTVASLKRVKEDVREVQKGLECGILLNNNNDVTEGDILEAYEISYIKQEL